MKYFHVFQKLKDKFDEVQVTLISQDTNDRIDELARLATSPQPRQLITFIQQTLPVPRILAKEYL